MTIALRDYQEVIALQACDLMQTHGVAYLAMEVRTGKTFTALHACSLFGAESVLFVSKLNALGSLRMDYEVMQGMGANYQVEFINWESLHKAPGGYDVIIMDEAHGLGQYPKPSVRATEARRVCEKAKAVLMLSGTPSPESTVQLFHQFWAAGRGPWQEYKSFYQWHKDHGDPWLKYINGFQVRQYDRAKAGTLEQAQPFMISWTQDEAGFKCDVREEVMTVPMPDHIAGAIRLLRRHNLFNTKDGRMVVADTAVKLMQKIHQLCGGTVICEDGSRIVADKSKAMHIKSAFAGQRVAVFYKYQAEREALEDVLGEGCADAAAFNATTGPAHILLQIQSGREGVNLSTADVLVMYNIDFAAVSYWQARARMQTMNRTEPARVVWLQYQGGIEAKILETVHGKKDYTLQHFRRETDYI
jgi:hypothetical protein